jgi:hypothetical protein
MARRANISTSSNDFSTRSGPFSERTSSAFLSRLGGKPIGLSNASNAAGRLRNCSSLRQLNESL